MPSATAIPTDPQKTPEKQEKSPLPSRPKIFTAVDRRTQDN
jgi:hypothetical protein